MIVTHKTHFDRNADSASTVADVLVDRLDLGWTLIEIEADPARKAVLERHWIALLRQYEVACSADADGAR